MTNYMRSIVLVLVSWGAVVGLVACDSGSKPAADNALPTLSVERSLDTRITDYIEANADMRGLVIAVTGPGDTAGFSAAAGVAAPDGRPLTADTPVRIASNTKTFVAATVLRLWERGEIDIDAPIAGLLGVSFDEMLRADGYDTDAITPRHLLMHVAGMPDHAGAQYAEQIMADPTRQWTREEQVALLVSDHDPLGPPESQFMYSDTGYILLGHMIERLTGAPLSSVVRREMDFAGLGLASTWWEQAENPPSSAAPRAHQYLQGADTNSWNASMDLYGGGGLVSTPRDLSKFMAALLRGDLFAKEETLEVMKSATGHPFPERYRIGLFPGDVGGYATFSHGGFWGTYAVYVPELDIALAGAALDQSSYRDMVALIHETVEEVASAR